ncbi:MAG: hypothetical protein N4A53_15575 [Pelagimonas sp.]|jgi:murein L,D-transpeptidase YafK|nr:hypothetical protein [Pelagimonas sp.]
MRRAFLALTVIGACAIAIWSAHDHIPTRIAVPLDNRGGIEGGIDKIRAARLPELRDALAQHGLAPGAPVHLRIFKEEARLDLYLQGAQGWQRVKSYPICAFSGRLGPKLREGDHQAPEGFYRVTLPRLNPNSRFHLSFNLGFPNAYDRSHGRTGSFLMVHGDCVSVGCYAMTDPVIEEIYLLVEAALRAGQPHVPVHAFPFEMTPARMAQAQGHDWYGFWQELQPAYLSLPQTGQVLDMRAKQGRYVAQPHS